MSFTSTPPPMPRLPLLLAALLVAAPVLTARAQSPATDAAPARSAKALPTPADALLPGFVPGDSPSDEELARRVAAFYERQAALLQADAAGDADRYAVLLDDLVADVQVAAQRPGMLLEPRFREVYSSVLTEYERFYERPFLDRGDVYALRAAGIDAVERGFDQGGPLLDHVTLPDFGAFVATIPMDVNPKVERYLQFLLNRPSHVERLRSRADTYFPMVERILAEEGVPDELKYLAMVESALNPLAQSHAGAAGMWQFIPATGRAYGLRAEREIDDRLDPETATRAAARHLRDLYDRFGDWQLALAGYNCNPAVIARGVKRFEAQTGRRARFWDIDHVIPQETRAYVPMFIATSLILSNPEAYGLTDYEPGPTYAFDRIPVAGGTRLATVARTIDVDEAVLRALNPSLKQGAVPNVRVPHMLRIPAGYYSQFAADLDRLAPPEAGAGRFVAESVQFGTRNVRPLAPQDHSEALVALATRRETRRAHQARPTPGGGSVERYAAAAPAQDASAAREAIALRAEEARRQAAAEVTLVAQNDRPEEAPAEAEAPARTEAPPVRTVSAPSARPVTTHRVQRGEYLTSIAKRYGTTVAEIRALNNLTSDTVHPGQKLKVTGDASAARAAAAPARPSTHRVRNGETLTSIARQYNVTIRQLRDWNGLSSDVIRPGQRLRLGDRGGRG